MAQLIVDLTLANHTYGVAYRTSEHGVIQGFGFSHSYVGILHGELFLEIGTVLGGRDPLCRNMIFFSGEPADNNGFLWSGAYELEPTEELYVKGYCIYDTTVRVNGKIKLLDC